MTNNIINRLRQARQAKNFLQKHMAEKLQISRAGYSRIENGDVEITLKNLFKIIKILDISVNWLLFGKEEDQTKEVLSFSDFGDYAETIKKMLKEMKENEVILHAVLSFFFELKKDDALKALEDKEKLEKQENEN
jgi:transcriptional regulator with XRE-family HTH domain